MKEKADALNEKPPAKEALPTAGADAASLPDEAIAADADGKAENRTQARLLDGVAEKLRQEGAKNKDMTKRHTLFGAAAGLEVAACALRDGVLAAPGMDVKKLLERYRATRIDYLLAAAPAALPRRRPPKLNVSRVVKGKGGKK